MLFPLALVLLAQKGVSTPSHAMRLDAFLRTLASETGEPYRVSDAMARRIVLSVGPPRPVEAIRADLAAATWGEWVRTDGGWSLHEDKEGILARERTRAALRTASVAKALGALKMGGAFDLAAAKALKRALDAPATPEEKGNDFQRLDRLSDGLPAVVATRRVLASLSAEELARLPDGRTVFSDQPTSLQRPLPSGATAAIRQLEADQNVWAGVHNDDETWKEGKDGVATMDPRNYADPVAPGGLRLVLVATVERTGMGFAAWFVDRTLRLRQFANANLEVSSSPLRTAAPAVDPNERPLALGGDAAAYAAALAGKPTPAMHTAMLAPERVEPLDLYAGEVVRAVARERNAAVTVWLDDAFVALSSQHQVSKARENTASEWLRALWVRGYNPQIREGAIVLRPRGAATNVDRAVLGRLLRAGDAAGFIPLDDLADFAAVSPSGQDDLPELASATLDALVPGITSQHRADWGLLRLWGALSPVQRHAFAGGSTLPFATLEVAQRERFVQAILHAGDNELQNQGAGHPFLTLESEPTELLAHGFRFAEGIVGRLDVEEGAFAHGTPGEPWTNGFVDARRLAQITFDRERAPNEERYDGMPKALSGLYVPGRIVSFGLTVPLSPTLSWAKSGQHGEFDLRAKPQSLDAMPPSFRKAYEETRSSLRKGDG